MRSKVIPLFIIFTCLFFGIGSIGANQKEFEDQGTPPDNIYAGNFPSEVPPLYLVEKMLEQVNAERTQTSLRQLSGEEPVCTKNGCFSIKNRLTGSEGLQWAKEYIYEELARSGYSVELRDWSFLGRADQNLIARKPGLIYPDQDIYLVAHIDGVNPEGVERSPAADDNASGAVGILEVAKILSEYTFQHTVVLFFSTGEEQGVLGARSYVDQLSPDELRAIKYVVNIDMIGYDANLDGVMEFWSGDHQPSLVFAQNLSDIVSAYPINLSPRIVTGCT